MNEVRKYKDFCTGCGLCHSIRNIELKNDEKGYLVPKLSFEDIAFCKTVCPCGGYNMKSSETWGHIEEVYYAWSEDDRIRRSASSGGVLTTICLYLLKHKIVDGIIQIRSRDIYATETVISTSAEDVLACMGSRYAISSPLLNIKEIVQRGKKYAFIGKPCDVSALRAYMVLDEEIKSGIPYMFSFFCAGMPSVDAQEEVLNVLGANKKECVSLQYRGNGWPGSTTVTYKDGSKKSMSYEESWGKILGRDVRRICRFCFDGIGQSADIACGDAWYMNDDRKPVFKENNGRNVVLLRTLEGKLLFEKCIREGIICGEKNSIDELQYIQKYQYDRRNTMIAKIAALRFCGKTYPAYPQKVMKQLARNATFRQQIRIFKGTVERCFNSKI